MLTMCRWIGSHFLDCIDFYGVAFSAIFNKFTRTGLHIFEILGPKEIMARKESLTGRFMVKKLIPYFNI